MTTTPAVDELRSRGIAPTLDIVAASGTIDDSAHPPTMVAAGHGQIVTGTSTGIVRSWNPADPSAPRWTATTAAIKDLDIVSTGRVAVATEDGVRVFEPDGRPVPLPQPEHTPICCDIGPDGYLITGTWSGLVHRFDLARPDPVHVSQSLTRGQVEAIAWLNNEFLATAGSDELVRIHDTDLTEISHLHDHAEYGPIRDLAPLGRSGFASGGWSGEIMLVHDIHQDHRSFVTTEHDSITDLCQLGNVVLVAASLDRSLLFIDVANPAAVAEHGLGHIAHSLAPLDADHLAIGLDGGFYLVTAPRALQ